jgi:hypothetical protein
VTLTIACGAGLLSGCSGDQSLGRGLPSGNTTDVGDAADATALPNEGGADRGSACSGHVGSDAGADLTAGLVAWYRCESAAGAAGTSLLDSSEHGNDATLVTGTGEAPGWSFGAGHTDNALYLDYTKQAHATMPVGLLGDACEVTVATWVYINSNVQTWTRIWDFGQDDTTYMFLAPITNIDNNFARFAISVNGNQHEQNLKATAAVPTQKWTHVALVLGPAGATLYFDGVSVGTNPSIALRPADLGRTINNYIARSQFASDPYLDGDIDEFRVYTRALSPEEIQALAKGD